MISHFDNSPLIDTLSVISPNGPYLVYQNHFINDSLGNANNQADYNENISIELDIKNFGTETAHNATISLFTQSEWINGFSQHQNINIGTLDAGQKIVVKDNFLVQLANNTPDKAKVVFSGKLQYNDSLERDFSFELTVNAPNIEFAEAKLDNTGVGNLNGILENNETVSLSVLFSNNGQSQVSNTVINFASSDTAKLKVNTETYLFGGFTVNEEKEITTEITAGDSIFAGSIVNLTYNIIAGDSGQYLFHGAIPITIGKEPVLKMKNDTVELISGWFYDSGGELSNYANNEDFRLVMTPHEDNSGLLVEFESFSVEPNGSSGCWDKLEVYNGGTGEAELIESMCDNTFKPQIISQNLQGGLSFRFKSDDGITRAGWKAHVRSVPQRSVIFKIRNATGPLEGAVVQLLHQTDTTNKFGEVSFRGVLAEEVKKYRVKYEGYYDSFGELDVLPSDSTLEITMERLTEVCFSVIDSNGPVKNAEVTFNNITLTTDSIGEATFYNQTEGTYKFTVRSQYHYDTTGFVTLSREAVCYFLNLKPLPTYSVNFEVTDYTGWVDTAMFVLEQKDTSYIVNGKLNVMGLYPGYYEYSIIKEGYHSVHSSFYISDSSLTKELQLEIIRHSVLFNITSNGQYVKDASVYLLDTVLTTSSFGQAMLNNIIPNSEIKYTIEKESYNTYQGSFSILDKNISLKIELTMTGISSRVINSLKISPNPVAGDRELKLVSENKMKSVEVYTLTGNILISKEISSREFQLPVNGLKKGIYIFKVTFEDGNVYNTKVLVN